MKRSLLMCWAVVLVGFLFLPQLVRACETVCYSQNCSRYADFDSCNNCCEHSTTCQITDCDPSIMGDCTACQVHIQDSYNSEVAYCRTGCDNTFFWGPTKPPADPPSAAALSWLSGDRCAK